MTFSPLRPYNGNSYGYNNFTIRIAYSKTLKADMVSGSSVVATGKAIYIYIVGSFCNIHLQVII